MMGGGPISWLSKNQAILALSIAEAEYILLLVMPPRKLHS